MEEKTVVGTSHAATVATTSAEETAATSAAIPAIPEQAECELPTVSHLQEPAFTIPLSSLDSLNKLTSFIGELYTYSYLLNKATGMSEPPLFIDSRVCDDLAEAITADEFRTVLKEFLTTKDVEYVKEIELKKEKKEKKEETDGDKLVFTCFKNLTDSDNTGMKQAVASLFNLMAASITNVADKKRRINLHKVFIKQPENEKFAFRSWLTKLGWKGAEGKMERNLLYRNLNGNTAFCTEESKIRWEAKHKKGRRTTAEEEIVVETTVVEVEAEPETDIGVAEDAVKAVAV